MKKYLSFVIATIFLTACSTLPNGKLSTSFKDVPIKADVIQKAPENPLVVRVPQTQVYNAGLIGALVSAAATEVSRQKRLPGITEIQNSFSPQKVFEAEGGYVSDVVRKADWISSQKLIKLKNNPQSDRKAVESNAIAKTEAPYVVSLSSTYILGEYFENLTQDTVMRINKVENGKSGMEVYKASVLSAFVPDGVEVEKDFTNYRVWTKNNNALLKEAIKSTNKQVANTLNDMLKDPYQIEKDS